MTVRTHTYEIIGNRSHSLVGQHYPNHDEIAACSHDNHSTKKDRPQQLPPPWQYEGLHNITEMVYWRQNGSDG